MALVLQQSRCWLAASLPAQVHITGRNESAAEHIIAETKSAGSTSEFICYDHTNLASIKEAADIILARESSLDVFIANAGIMALPSGLRSDGYDLHFGINHVAHALLIRKLLLPI
ncbi:hypothetical protein OPQ81_010400 [Rhizoctonia solani]|nr:hypothetical protein OPQ81_010400 [Rhizoctonia solani]